MGSPIEEPGGLYGIDADGQLPSSRRVAALYALLVIGLLIVPAVAAIGSRSTWLFVAVAVGMVVATVVWLMMGRHLVSIHVHRSNDGDLWINGTTVWGGEITALVSEVERVKGPPTRQSHAGLELAQQKSVGLGMSRNDVAAFIERLAADLPPETGVKEIRYRWVFSDTKRFYDHSTVKSSQT